MNEERTGKCLRQVGHMRGHLWYKCSVTVNQDMVATINLSKWWLQLNQLEPCVLSWKAANTYCIVFGWTRPGLEPKTYCTQDEYGNHYATDAICKYANTDDKLKCNNM
jgi:hypothetical protein